MLRADGVVAGNDLYSSLSVQALFHQQALDASDVEHYDMAFPPFTDGVHQGPAISAGTAGALPFGPVSLAFPSLHEDVAQKVVASQTGFFAANYNYRPEAVYGNVPLTTGYPYALRQAIRPAPLSGGLSLYPEQYDTWWLSNRAKELNKSAARPTSNQTNQAAPNQTALNEPAENLTTSIQAPAGINNSTLRAQVKASGLKPPLAIEYFKPKNASTKPWEMPVVYPEVFNLAGRDYPALPNPGIGAFSTNGAGSTGASLTGPPAMARPVNLTGNKTTGNKTAPEEARSVTPPAGNALTYAGFNFDATTEQINEMPILERMWRNSHRGGQMGKAYIGDTSMPRWIDPYDRPNDLSMLDEHWYCLQSALNMVVPGTQIMPRFWSLGII